MSKSLQEAMNAVTGDRRRDYGSPLINHLRIAMRWNILLANRLMKPITPVQVALMMVDLKIAREQQTHKDDNFVDMAGYISCIDSMQVDMVELGYEDGIGAFVKMSFDDLNKLLRRLELEQDARNYAGVTWVELTDVFKSINSDMGKQG